MRQFYLLELVPPFPYGRKTVDPTAWTPTGGYPNVWEAPVGQNAQNTTPPYISGRAIFNSAPRFLDLRTGVESAQFTAAANLATVNSVPLSFLVEDHVLYVNPGGRDLAEEVLVVYFVEFLYRIGVAPRLWLGSDRFPFQPTPVPVWPYLVNRALSVTETLSSLERVTVADTDLRVVVANPLNPLTGLRYWADLGRGDNPTVRVGLDDDAFADCAVTIWRAEAPRARDLTLSPNEPGNPWSVFYRGTLREPRSDYSTLQRPQVELTLRRTISAISAGALELDTLARLDLATSTPASNVQRVYGTRRVLGEISTSYQTAAPLGLLTWVKLAAGPLQAVNWVSVNGSDPLRLEPYASGGQGPVVDLRTGWVGFPFAILDPYLRYDGTDQVLAEVVGQLEQQGLVEELVPEAVLAWDSDAPPGFEVTASAPTQSYPLVWGKSAITTAQNEDLGGGQVVLRVTGILGGARCSTPVSAADVVPLGDLRLVEVRFRQVSGTPISWFQVTLGAAEAALRFDNVAAAGGAWQTYRALVHPLHPTTLDDETVDVDVLQDGWALNRLQAFQLEFAAGDGTTVFELDYVRLSRLGSTEKPAEAARQVILEATPAAGNLLPDGELVGRGLDAAVKEEEGVTWVDPVGYGNARNALEVQPFGGLTLRLPEQTAFERGYSLVVVASPLLPAPRSCPFFLLFNSLADLTDANPPRSTRREQTLVPLASCDPCYLQQVAVQTRGDGLYLSLRYVPPLLRVATNASPTTLVNVQTPTPANVAPNWLRVGDQVAFVRADATTGWRYERDATVGAKEVYSVTAQPTPDSFWVDEPVTLATDVFAVALEVPLRISLLALRPNVVEVPDQTRELLHLTAVARRLTERRSLPDLLTGLYQGAGLLPAPTREGSLALRVVDPIANLHAREALHDGRAHDVDLASFQVLGDVDKYFSEGAATGEENPLTGEPDVEVSATPSELRRRAPREPSLVEFQLAWRHATVAVRTRLRLLLLRSLQPGGAKLRLVGNLAETLQVGDHLNVVVGDLREVAFRLVAKTVTRTGAGVKFYADVTAVAYDRQLQQQVLRYEVGGATYDGTYRYL